MSRSTDSAWSVVFLVVAWAALVGLTSGFLWLVGVRVEPAAVKGKP